MNAQLRASQIENRHLRRCGVPTQLQELQDAYAQSTEALEVRIIQISTTAIEGNVEIIAQWGIPHIVRGRKLLPIPSYFPVPKGPWEM